MAEKVFAVTSGKGGVGKTTTAINLAAALGTESSPSVIVDADLGMADVGTFLGLDPDRTLHDVLAGTVPIEDAITSVSPGFDAVVGDRGLDAFANADPDGVGPAVDTLAEQYRYVVIDTGGGLSYESMSPLSVADAAVLVTSPLPAAVENTQKSAQLAVRAGVPVRGVVVTHANDRTDPGSIAETLGVELLGTVRDDPVVGESAEHRESLLEYAPDSEPAASYRRISAALTDESETDRMAANWEPAVEEESENAEEKPAAEEEPENAENHVEEPSIDEREHDDNQIRTENDQSGAKNDRKEERERTKSGGLLSRLLSRFG